MGSSAKVKIGDRGLAIIKRSEGLKLEAYLDTGRVPTIGYGHTRGVKLGLTCIETQALAWLREDCEDAEAAVTANIRVPLSQNQFDALVSFTFNVGTGALESSTLRKMLNAGNYGGAADQLLRWNKDNGVVLAGLTTRRAAERNLFLAND